mgnify:FL=1
MILVPLQVGCWLDQMAMYIMLTNGNLYKKEEYETRMGI